MLLELLDDLNSRPHSTERPRACSHEIVFSPKIAGMSQFQSSHTGMLTSSAMMAPSATTPRPMTRYFIFCFAFDVMPNHALQRTAASRLGFRLSVSQPPSLSLGYGARVHLTHRRASVLFPRSKCFSAVSIPAVFLHAHRATGFRACWNSQKYSVSNCALTIRCSEPGDCVPSSFVVIIILTFRSAYPSLHPVAVCSIFQPAQSSLRFVPNEDGYGYAGDIQDELPQRI